MTETTCPACGEAASGRFCSNCGASLPGRVACTACGNEIPAGGRFCNQCGTPTPAAAAAATPASDATELPVAESTPRQPVRSRPASTVPWVIAALAVLALIIALVLPGDGGDDPIAQAPEQLPVAQPGAAGAADFGDAGSVDLSTMTPRERADALFNRVMQNVSSGDSTQAEFFLPMAIAAYEQVPELNADGHYHLAVLHLAGGDPGAARARADSILSETSTHLYGLFTAAQAEQALGNVAAAREMYERFGAAFAAETALARPEYEEHQAVIPLMREEAAQALQDL